MRFAIRCSGHCALAQTDDGLGVAALMRARTGGEARNDSVDGTAPDPSDRKSDYENRYNMERSAGKPVQDFTWRCGSSKAHERPPVLERPVQRERNARPSAVSSTALVTARAP